MNVKSEISYSQMKRIYIYVKNEDGTTDRYSANSKEQIIEILKNDYENFFKRGTIITDDGDLTLLETSSISNIIFYNDVLLDLDKKLYELVNLFIYYSNNKELLYKEIEKLPKHKEIVSSIEDNLVRVYNVIDSSNAGYYLGSISCELDYYMFFPEHYSRDTGYFPSEESVKSKYPYSITYSEAVEILKSIYNKNKK